MPAVTDPLLLPAYRPEYRAKDIVMAATIDTSRRLVLITGAIDSNDHDILVRLELPAPGRWQIAKAETNLTDKTWWAWQITFDDDIAVVDEPGSVPLCRQFPLHHVAPDRSRLTFYGGEIRPGEAVLKVWTVNTGLPRIFMSHNRGTVEFDDGDFFNTDFEAAVRRGFEPRPYIEAFLPTFVI